MDRTIKPVFTLDLGYKILPGLVTIGKYDGSHPCLTAATMADRIVIHSPHRRPLVATGRMLWSETNREIATLNINQKVTAIAAGLLVPNEERDVLVYGTATHIMAYHVHDNMDIFYVECQDGVKAIAIGKFGDNKAPTVFVGGNSSIHGYNHTGKEVFWVPVGDVVTSIALIDYNRDGLNELLISAEDFNIRVFKGDQIVAEHAETETVTGLATLSDKRFAYSVSNGTVGVYEQGVRLWRVKSKNFAISMHSYDLLGTGDPQLITGWSNGKLDCRSETTGEVFFKDGMTHGVAGVVEGDYRSIGKPDLICVSTEGEVRGYTTTKSLPLPAGGSLEQDTVRELLAQKQALQLELKQYENNTKYNEESDGENININGVIPASTRLQIVVTTNTSQIKPHVEIFISTNNDTVIKAVIVFAEGIFKGETHVAHPPNSKLKPYLSLPLFPTKDAPVDIHLKAMVGYPNSIQYHVFEITRQLPRFSMYSLTGSKEVKCASYVTFKISERLQRICMWINQNFLVPDDLEYDSEPNLKVHFKSLRDNTDVFMHFSVSGKTFFYTENMGLAADLIQTLGAFLNLDNLESTASFDADEKQLAANMEKLASIQEARMQLNADIADNLQQVRNLLLLAEDSRVNNELNEMSAHYTELNVINKELINGYNIRLANYNDGLETMKHINLTLQNASRLRVGNYSANVISCSRTAIIANNVQGLIKIIRTGSL